jgi:4-hydroxybenzoate polyprenyltransferase
MRIQVGAARASSDRGHSRRALLESIRGHVRLMRPYAWLWFDLLPAATLILLLEPVGLGLGRLIAFLLAVVLADAGVSTLNDL